MPEIQDESQKPVSGGKEKTFKNPISNLLSKTRAARQPKDIRHVQSSLNENPLPFILEPGRNINQLYEGLKQLEAKPPDRDELIRIVGLNPSQPEFSHLENTGVESSTLEARRIARGTLLDAGYVFLNRIGGGEKPLIRAQVPVAVEESVEIIDMGKKVLLTQAELDAVIQYQKSHPGVYTTESADIDLIREDMLLFLQQAIGEQNNLEQNANAVFRAAQGRILNDPKYTDEDRKVLKQFFTQQYEKYQKKGSSNLGYIMQECMAGIDVAKVRGLPFEIFAKRLTALQNSPSPFLDSGFHFDTNFDVTLYPHDPTQTRRLNMAVIHLLSRGLNEMGESANESHDQRYVTAGEYEKQVYQKEMVQATVSDKDLDLIAGRLLFRARKSNLQTE